LVGRDHRAIAMRNDDCAPQLVIEALRRDCPPESLGIACTAEVTAPDGSVGRSRAQAAIAFGLDVRTPGSNSFVAGPAGTLHARVDGRLEERAAAEDDVPDIDAAGRAVDGHH